MGLLTNKFVAAFINGGSPPASYTIAAAAPRPAPFYSEHASGRALLQNSALERTQIYLKLPTAREREELEREERERRVRECGKSNSLARRVKRKVEHVTEFSGRTRGFGGGAFGG